jgi:hypothetical protein
MQALCKSCHGVKTRSFNFVNDTKSNDEELVWKKDLVEFVGIGKDESLTDTKISSETKLSEHSNIITHDEHNIIFSIYIGS